MKPSEQFQKGFLFTLMILTGLWGVSRAANQLMSGSFDWLAAVVPFMMTFVLFFHLMVFQHRSKEDERWRRIMERSFFFSSVIVMTALAAFALFLAPHLTDWTALQTVLAIFVLFGLANAVTTIVLTKRM